MQPLKRFGSLERDRMVLSLESRPVRPRRHAELVSDLPASKSSLVRLIDALDVPALLVSRAGQVAVTNGPARSCFIGGTGLQLRQAIETLARKVSGDRRRDGAPNRSHSIEAGCTRFAVTFVVAGADVAHQDIGAMVLLRREAQTHPTPSSEGALARRFGLTVQEARVTVMLADHRSNRDIAAALGVSVHTARHHTERVLAKLHIHSRYDVRRVIS